MICTFRFAKRFLVVPLLSIVAVPQAPATSEFPNAGAVFEIVQSYETSSETNGDGSSSSSGHSTLIERVIRVDEDGVELEYLEAFATDAERKRGNWQLPANIYRPKNGVPVLLNADELEQRVDPWLKMAKATRDACGKWIFTWNAFKIECDPTSALGIVEQYNLWLPSLSEGALYSEEGALTAVPLQVKSRDETGSVYFAELEIDPEKVKSANAETDVVVGKIMGEPTTFDDSLAKQADDRIAGTILVTIEANAQGWITKRTNTTKFRIESGGEVETISKTVTLERRPFASTGSKKLQ